MIRFKPDADLFIIQLGKIRNDAFALQINCLRLSSASSSLLRLTQDVDAFFFFFNRLICPCLQLKSLGELCGLVSEKGPTSEDLNRTVDLLAGLGDERPETGTSFFLSGTSRPDHVELREVLLLSIECNQIRLFGLALRRC